MALLPVFLYQFYYGSALGEFIRKGRDVSMRRIDSTDKEIITLLQKNARMPLKEIAANVHMSSPSVSARIERLERDGVILGYQARVNPVMMNYHIKAFINLEVEPVQKTVFYPFIKKISNVVECNCVTGDYAMLIETLFETTTELDHFVNELQQFGRTKTLIVFSTSVEHREAPIKEIE